MTLMRRYKDFVTYLSLLVLFDVFPLSFFMLISQELDDSIIPVPIPLSSEHIATEGIYLLENGVDCLIYLGDNVQPNILQQMFGISSLEDIPNQVLPYKSGCTVSLVLKVLYFENVMKVICYIHFHTFICLNSFYS